MKKNLLLRVYEKSEKFWKFDINKTLLNQSCLSHISFFRTLWIRVTGYYVLGLIVTTLFEFFDYYQCIWLLSVFSEGEEERDRVMISMSKCSRFSYCTQAIFSELKEIRNIFVFRYFLKNIFVGERFFGKKNEKWERRKLKIETKKGR